jgi:flagellar basal body-associated protein FliL
MMWTERTTKTAIIVFVVVVLLILALAAYGYYSGAWESAPAAS